jgi:hypothetical protein
LRRHATKAASAPSTWGRATSSASFIRGALASRGASGDVGGSGGPSRGRVRPPLLATLCLAIAGFLALCASPTFAAQTHPYTGTSFGPDGVGGTQSFEGLRGVAVDPATGDVYAYDGSAHKIYKFDSSGAPSNFSALGANVITGVGGGAGGGELEIALAPAGSPGSTAGDIYVANNSQALQVYGADGTKLGEVEQGGETCGVATDPSGNLYAGVYSQKVNRYTPTANPPTTANKTTGIVAHGICNVAADGLGNVYAANFGGSGLYKLEGIGDTTPTQVDPMANTMAVAPGSNDLYADRRNEIVQYDSSGNLTGSFGSGELSGSFGVAINTGASKIYVDNGLKVKVFGAFAIVPDATTEAATAITKVTATLHGTVSAAGGPEATCVFQYTTVQQFSAHGFVGAEEKPCSPAGPFTGSSSTSVSAVATGLATETDYRFRLLASSENGLNGGQTLNFSTPGAVNLETGAATNIADSNATLNGTINPEGTLLEECRFDYGKTDTYGSTVPCAESPATIGSGDSPVTVHADLTGLTGGTGYHFRLAAKNEFGTSMGEDASFKTLAPTIESESLVGVGLTSAIFKAQINPNGEETSYVFEYVSEAEFEAGGFAGATELPVGGEAIGAGTSGVEVEQEATGLTPRTTYHVRVVATNPGGVTTGSQLVFSTFSPASSGLPDGRAYEQATPVDKDGGNAQGERNDVRTPPDGNGISFIVNGGIPGAEGGQNISSFLSLRSPSGWSTQGLLAAAKYGAQSKTLGLSEDLSVDYTSAAIPSIENSTFEKDTLTKQYTTIYNVVKNEYEASSTYDASSADNEQALFEVEDALGPGAAQFGYPNLYLWDRPSQQFILAGVFNDGEAPVEGVRAGPWDWFNGGGGGSTYFLQEEHALSADGSHVFFTDLENNQLYMRVNPTQPQSALSGGECTEPSKACTYQVSESQRSTPDPEGTKNAKFLTATADGSKVFFMSAEDLTDDAHTGPSEGSNDLYSYDTQTHILTDLTATTLAENPNGADVSGILGISKDGSYVYFGAGGALAPGATQGNCSYVNYASGQCNVYLWHEGASEPISFIARLNGGNSAENSWLSQNWAAANSGTGSSHSARVSTDGKTLVLYSGSNLTGYDSHGDAEFYRYHVGDSDLQCISCAPSGEAPQGEATFESITPGFIAVRSLNAYNTRNMSADGNRVFFETIDKLVGADTNGVKDVYEWEAEGSGSCTSHDQNGGCLYLISTGTSPQPSFFGDSSENGEDAYFYTTQPLVGQDRDELVDIYGARVGGGFAYQNPPPPSICTGEACRPQTSAPPAGQSPGTSSFSGPGNPQPKKHHKKHHKKKHHKKKHHKKGAKRQQGSNR